MGEAHDPIVTTLDAPMSQDAQGSSDDVEVVLGVGTEVASLVLVPTPGRGRDAGKPAADAQELRVD